MITRLSVQLDFGNAPPAPVAQLGWDSQARHGVAEWAAAFRQSPLPLSPLITRRYDGLLRPGARAFGDLPALFGDSLPDGWGRLLMDRELSAQGRALRDITDLDRLAMIGSDGMGALTYHPADPLPPQDRISLDWFDRLVPEIGGDTTAGDLERLRQMAGGSQGARPKFVAQIAEGGGTLRGHRHPWASGWRHVLAKRRALSDPPGAIEAEAAYAQMARQAGITMQPTHIIRATSEEPFFITDRFDRDGPNRLHMQTVAALLDVDFRTATLDYGELIKLTRIMTRDYRDVEQMFLRMVFNARVLNRDDHLKNHAFLMGRDGVWRLSPAYDVSYSIGPGGEHSLLIAGDGRHPGRAQFQDIAKQAGIKPKRANDLIEQVDAAAQTWPTHAEQAEVPPALRSEIAHAITDAASW